MAHISDSIVIIPTYNEKENIEKIIRAVFGLEKCFHILVIDDGSPDGTAAIVKGMMAQEEFSDRLFILERSGKLGLGTAYITGFKWALERDYGYIFEMDADFSHDPNDLPRLYAACADEGYDVAIGSRYVSGVNVVNWPIGRVLMSYFASKYVRIVTGFKVHDTTAGFKCYKRRVLQTIELDKIRFKGYGFQIEMKFTAYKIGFKIKEVPVIFVNRREGVSKMSGGIFGEAFFGVMRLRWDGWTRKYPKMLPVVLACLFTGLNVQAKDNVVLRRNQVGCSPNQEKVIVVEGTNPGSKMRITTPDGKVVKAKNVRRAVSPLSNKTRYVVDLGNLSATGDYRVALGNESCVLHVSEQPYHDIAKSALRLFYLIRSGIAINLGGAYNRPLGHPDTHVLVHPSAASPLRPAGTVINSPYGWYDAGDYNKYVVNSAFSIGLMFAAYEQQRDYFTKLNTNIPESRNATPDFLDEMMFNLRWLMTMQDPYDGGVYHKLTTPNFEGFVMPTDCKQTRYVVAKSVTATLDFAAVMADAARFFEPYQQDYPGFAAQAAAMAERAYQWAKANPRVFYMQRQLKDPAVTTGEYGDRSANDEFFWAASALYRLTGNKQYLNDARQYHPKQFTLPTWGNVASLGAFEWLACNSELSADMQAQLIAYCEETVKEVATSSFQSPYGNKARDFGWGCLAENCCCQALALLYADKMTGTKNYRRYALQNADYLFGRNATGYCYVTGFGDQSPMHPHHRPSAADNVEAPFPGMLVGGPNPGQQDKQNMKATYPSNVPDESYIDDAESYASNEIAINWNASLVAFLCWLDALTD